MLIEMHARNARSNTHSDTHSDTFEHRYKKRIAEQKELDHRKTGTSQSLFFMHDLSPGSAFFLPHGARVYARLQHFIRNQYWNRGYDEVVSPNIFNSDLFKISGHYQKYEKDMFWIQSQSGEEFGLKPMNCPGHCLMFRNKNRSHRDLPMRLADFGVRSSSASCREYQIHFF